MWFLGGISRWGKWVPLGAKERGKIVCGGGGEKGGALKLGTFLDLSGEGVSRSIMGSMTISGRNELGRFWFLRVFLNKQDETKGWKTLLTPTAICSSMLLFRGLQRFGGVSGRDGFSR